MGGDGHERLGGLARGFHSVVSALFDFSFTEFVTTRLVKAIYVLALVLAGLVSLLSVAYALSRSLLTGLLAVLVAAALFALVVLATRIWLEALLVLFRLADHTAEMLEHEAAIAMNTSSPQVESSRDRGRQPRSSEG